MSKDRARLLDILDWARRAMLEAAGRTRADFDSDENFFLAQVKRVEVVGEAASRLTSDTRRQMPEVLGPLLPRRGTAWFMPITR